MKAVLVMDMPNGCGGCRLASWQQGRVYCKVTGEGIKVTSEREDFCPLRPMPENKRGYMGADDAYEEGHGYGFNDCLRMIEGSGEDGK